VLCALATVTADTEAAQTAAKIVAFESSCEANMIILSRMVQGLWMHLMVPIRC